MKRNSIPLLISYFAVISIFAIVLLSCTSSKPELTMGTVLDIDGNEYKTVNIGDQWWMAENLRVTNYQDGTPISKIADGEKWSFQEEGAYCAYENDYENVIPYGLLYNWFAAVDERNICPEGWHVPSDDEWKELELYLGMSQEEIDEFGWRGTDIGGKLKEAGTEHWEEPNTGATNETGLSVIPNGGRASGASYEGGFFYRGSNEAIWSSSEYDDNKGIFREFWNTKSEMERKNYSKRNGFSVRCIQD